LIGTLPILYTEMIRDTDSMALIGIG